MSFAAKVDYIGLERDGLSLRSNAQNATVTNLEIPGADGSILGTEQTGYVSAPTCGYAITGTATLSGVALGKVHNTTLDAPYALSRVRISTGAGQEPTIECDSVQIEDGATRTICIYPLDDLSVTMTPARHAITFNAFDFTESLSCALQTSEFEASANLSPATVNNDPVASDSTAGQANVNVTVWTNSEDTPPAITPKTGWTTSNPWTCTGADASMFSWTATLTKYLSADSGV